LLGTTFKRGEAGHTSVREQIGLLLGAMAKRGVLSWGVAIAGNNQGKDMNVDCQIGFLLTATFKGGKDTEITVAGRSNVQKRGRHMSVWATLEGRTRERHECRLAVLAKLCRFYVEFVQRNARSGVVSLSSSVCRNSRTPYYWSSSHTILMRMPL
jgi:hypothetical protein